MTTRLRHIPTAQVPTLRSAPRWHKLPVCVGVVLATVAVGCGGDDDDAASTENTSDASVESTSTDDAAGLDAIGAANRAIDTTPGFVVGLGQGTVGGREVWEVVLVLDDGSGTKHYIAADDGENLRQEPTDVPAEAEIPPIVSIQAALTEAVAAVPGSIVVEADVGTLESAVVWQVLLAGPSNEQVEVEIDTTTGEVLENEPTG